MIVIAVFVDNLACVCLLCSNMFMTTQLMTFIMAFHPFFTADQVRVVFPDVFGSDSVLMHSASDRRASMSRSVWAFIKLRFPGVTPRPRIQRGKQRLDADSVDQLKVDKEKLAEWLKGVGEMGILGRLVSCAGHLVLCDGRSCVICLWFTVVQLPRKGCDVVIPEDAVDLVEKVSGKCLYVVRIRKCKRIRRMFIQTRCVCMNS